MTIINDELKLLLRSLREKVGGYPALPDKTGKNPSNSTGASDFPDPSPFIEYDGQTRRVFVYGLSEYGPDSEDVFVPTNLSKRKATRYFLTVKDR